MIDLHKVHARRSKAQSTIVVASADKDNLSGLGACLHHYRVEELGTRFQVSNEDRVPGDGSGNSEFASKLNAGVAVAGRRNRASELGSNASNTGGRE